MRSLTHRGFWLTIGVALVVTVILLTLWPRQDGPVPEVLADKTGHVIAYFVLVVWFAGLFPRSHHLMFGAGFFAMGVGLEWLQGFMDARVSDVLDMVANAGGAVMGLVVARLGLDGWCQWVENLIGKGQ
ncbi:MAG: VanZ family protein [Pseudomonadota bacterium]